MTRREIVLPLATLLFLPLTLLADTGLITTVAGNGYMGTAGVGGPATSAQMTNPVAFAVDDADNLYIGDLSNQRVVRVDAVSGVLSLVAGTGTAASTGDSGPANQASLNYPYSLALDSAGNLFIAEYGGNRIRRVDAVTGIIATVVGTGTSGWTGDGGSAASATLSMPMGIAMDSAGNLYIADTGNKVIRRVDGQTGIITTIAGNGAIGYTPDGSPAAGSSLDKAMWVSIDASGNLLVSEWNSYSLRRIDKTTGLLSTVAGNGVANYTGDGVAATSTGARPLANAASDASGNLFFADVAGRIRRVDAITGVITTVAGNGSGAQGLESAGGGGGGGGPYPCPANLGDNGNATNATLDGPAVVALTQNGNLVFTDWIDCRVRRVFLPSPLAYTNIVLNSSATSIPAGQNVTFTATVSPIGATGTPTGTIQFVDGIPTGSPVLGTATLNNGTASLTVNSLQYTAAYHQIVAYYTGDGAFNGSGSPAFPLNVTYNPPPPATVTLTSSQNPVLPNTPVTFTVVVAPPSGSTTQPTGLVQLLDGLSQVGSGNLTNGSIQFTVSFAAAGNHNITAIYNGDANYGYTSSPLMDEMVTGPGSVSLSSSPNPSTSGSYVTFVANVTPSSATGTVQFQEGSSTLYTGTVTSGVAYFSTASLSVGQHTIQAVYSGDGAITAATSATVTQTVQAPTSLSLSAGTGPILYGSNVTLTATITPSAATGSIQFMDGTTPLGSSPLTGGTAAVTISSLSAGTHALTASYAGDGVYVASNATLTVSVGKAATTDSLTVDSQSVLVGQTVTFTATVAPAAATGTVQFFDGGTTVGTVAVNNGTALLPVSTFTAGTHNINSLYSGDSNYASSSSSYAGVIVRNTTTTTLQSNAPSAPVGQAIQFTASVTPSTATGMVSFLDNGTSFGGVVLSNGTAVLTNGSLTIGTHSITAVYNGDGGNATSTSAVWTQTITRTPTTTVFSSVPNPSTAGAAVTLTASVQQSGASGTIQFVDVTTPGSPVTLGAGTMVNGTATLSTSFTAGSHSLQANYSGDASFLNSVSAVLVQAVKATTTVSLSANPTSIVAGQAVQFTATVVPSAATGTVQFFDGGTSLGTATVNNGVAVLSVSTLSAGVHNVGALYSGDNNYAGNSGYAPVVVKAVTTTSIGSSANPSAVGQSVTFAANVSPSTATGTIVFADGGTSLGTVNLTNGTAALAISSLAVGSHSITASYSGDAANATSVSAALTQNVVKTNSAVLLGSSLNPSLSGQVVTFSAVVSPGTATGTVQFLDGASVLGTAAVSGGAAALSTSGLVAGNHTITAVYSGDGNLNGSSTAIVQTVRANTATSVISNNSSVVYGTIVTFTASVSPTAATGSIQFLDGARVLGTVGLSAGSAALALSSLAVGTHSITAVYSGDGIYNSSTSAVWTQIIKAPPAPTLSAAPSPNQADLGQSVVVTLVGTNFIAGATGINFLSGSGMTASNVTVLSSTQLTATFTVAANASLGVRQISVTTPGGTSGTRNFFVYGVPVITSISPTSGSRGTNVSVTLRGSNFSRDSVVEFSGTGITTANQSISNEGQTLRVTFSISSSAPTGPQSVTVSNSVGVSNAVQFTVN